MVNHWTERETVRQLAAQSGNITLAEELAWRDVLGRHFNTGRRTAHLLDIGTGTGWLPILLANRRLIATGLDSSEPLLDVARQRAWEAQKEVRFVLGSAENLQFPNAAYDIITAVNLLSDLDDPRAAVTSWERVLKPAGRLLIVEDDRDSAHYATYLKANDIKRNQSAPLYNANCHELICFLKLRGWGNVHASQIRGQLERTGTYRFRPYTLGYTLVVAEKGGSIPL